MNLRYLSQCSVRALGVHGALDCKARLDSPDDPGHVPDKRTYGLCIVQPPDI
jgi:hypothetical protein